MAEEGLYLFQHLNKEKEEKFVAISSTAMEKGLLCSLPDGGFLLFLLLFSRADNTHRGEISWSKLKKLLPWKEGKIEELLEDLKKENIVHLQKTGKMLLYTLNLTPLFELQEGELAGLEQEERFLSELLSGRPVSEQELVKGLVLILAPEKLTPFLRSEIEDIMGTFSPEIVRELIRRVKKAVDENPDLRPLPYLRAIVKDWVNNEIFTYEDLQKADKLHRETYELALEFGLQRAKELTPYHKQTILSWITQKDEDDYALSADVARLAIQEAIKRKRDGRPSLDYIERNFIIPWKKAGISSREEAQEFLLRAKEKPGKKGDEDWDFEKFLDN